MSDQSDYIDPASQFPAGLPTDAALFVLHNRLTALERATDNEPEAEDTDPAAVDRPADPYDQATAQERDDFRAWLDAGRPSAPAASPDPRPGLTGSPSGSPAGPVSTGAGPENPTPVAVGENPDPSESAVGLVPAADEAKPAAARRPARHH